MLCDILMPDGNGLDLLREIKAVDADAAVIMMTAYTSTKSAIEAMKLGAYDYISKPFDVDELKIVAQKALEQAELADENVYLRRELEQKYTFNNIIGKSAAHAGDLRADRARRAHRLDGADQRRERHRQGADRPRHPLREPARGAPFVAINCAALPENLLESELFGHERGAFTGAVRDKKGLFEVADGGTLFLDEIGEMSPLDAGQAAARAPGEGGARSAATIEEPVDVRIIAATNRDLEEPIAQRRVPRGPLLPPQRHPDPPAAAARAPRGHPAAGRLLPAASTASRWRCRRQPISVEAMQMLESYDWPGNVRELENLIERALALSHAETITTRDLPVHLLTNRGATRI